jgi:hypothetical protein
MTDRADQHDAPDVPRIQPRTTQPPALTSPQAQPTPVGLSPASPSSAPAGPGTPPPPTPDRMTHGGGAAGGDLYQQMLIERGLIDPIPQPAPQAPAPEPPPQIEIDKVHDPVDDLIPADQRRANVFDPVRQDLELEATGLLTEPDIAAQVDEQMRESIALRLHLSDPAGVPDDLDPVVDIKRKMLRRQARTASFDLRDLDPMALAALHPTEFDQVLEHQGLAPADPSHDMARYIHARVYGEASKVTTNWRDQVDPRKNRLLDYAARKHPLYRDSAQAQPAFSHRLSLAQLFSDPVVGKIRAAKMAQRFAQIRLDAEAEYRTLKMISNMPADDPLRIALEAQIEDQALPEGIAKIGWMKDIRNAVGRNSLMIPAAMVRQVYGAGAAIQDEINGYVDPNSFLHAGVAVADDIDSFAQRVMPKSPEAAEAWTLRWWATSAAEQIPNLALMISTGFITKAMAQRIGASQAVANNLARANVVATIGALEGGHIRQSMVQHLVAKGWTPEEANINANASALVAGTIAGLMELAPFAEFVLRNKPLRNMLINGVRGMAVEGLTELGQGLVSKFADMSVGDEFDADAAMELLQEAFIGATVGGPVGALTAPSSGDVGMQNKAKRAQRLHKVLSRAGVTRRQVNEARLIAEDENEDPQAQAQARQIIERYKQAQVLVSVASDPILKGSTIEAADRDGELVDVVTVPNGKQFEVRQVGDMAELRAMRDSSPRAAAESIVAAIAETAELDGLEQVDGHVIPTDADGFLDLSEADRAYWTDRFGQVPGMFVPRSAATGNYEISADAATFLATGAATMDVVTEELVHALDHLGVISPEEIRALAEWINPNSTNVHEDAARAIYNLRRDIALGKLQTALQPAAKRAIRRIIEFFQELYARHIGTSPEAIGRRILSGHAGADTLVDKGPPHGQTTDNSQGQSPGRRQAGRAGTAADAGAEATAQGQAQAEGPAVPGSEDGAAAGGPRAASRARRGPGSAPGPLKRIPADVQAVIDYFPGGTHLQHLPADLSPTGHDRVRVKHPNGVHYTVSWAPTRAFEQMAISSLEQMQAVVASGKHHGWAGERLSIQTADGQTLTATMPTVHESVEDLDPADLAILAMYLGRRLEGYYDRNLNQILLNTDRATIETLDEENYHALAAQALTEAEYQAMVHPYMVGTGRLAEIDAEEAAFEALQEMGPAERYNPNDEDLSRSILLAMRDGLVSQSLEAADETDIRFASRAHHGSPVLFDTFSLDYIGSGEGIQAYGWGLYFADTEAVAEWYRRNLAYREYRVAGQPVHADNLREHLEVTVAEALNLAEETDRENRVLKTSTIGALVGQFETLLEMYSATPAAAMTELRNRLEYETSPFVVTKFREDVVNEIEAIAATIETPRQASALEGRIALALPEMGLDWYTRLSREEARLAFDIQGRLSWKRNAEDPLGEVRQEILETITNREPELAEPDDGDFYSAHRVVPEYRRMLELLEKYDWQVRKGERKGAVYTVDLAPADHEYLLWDKPLSEQSPLVRGVLDSLLDRYREVWPDDKSMIGDPRGADIYELLAEKPLSIDAGPPTQEKASKLLLSLGVRGVKYLDGTSRTDGEGNYNYVIFDDADVQVVSRAASRQDLDGEYWLDDGQAIFADGDVGDMNHELSVIQRATTELIDAIRESDNPKVDGLEEVLEADEEYGIDPIGARDALANWADGKLGDGTDGTWTEEEVDDLYETITKALGIEEELLDVALGNMADARDYGLEQYGMVRMAGNSLQTFKLDRGQLEQIASGIYDAHDDKAEDQTYDIEVMATGKFYTGVPWSVIDAGDMAALRDYDSSTGSFASRQRKPRAKKYEQAELKKRTNKVAFEEADPDLQALLQKHEGTPWAIATLDALALRREIRMTLEGRQPQRERMNQKLYDFLSTEGWQGAWDYAAITGVLGEAEKVAGGRKWAINSSLTNCVPTDDCAAFCYASTGRYMMDANHQKSELLDILAKANPEKFAELAAIQFKAQNPNLWAKRALRLFDKGDFDPGGAWVEVIEQLNQHGIRVQIFSKRPDQLAKVDPSNVRLLSVDGSGLDLAEGNDLPVAFVYQDAVDLPALTHLADQGRIQVILPVKLKGGQLLGSEEVAGIPRLLKRYLCPIDAGWKQLPGAAARSGGSAWWCTRCDERGKGIGCFYGQRTEAQPRRAARGILNKLRQTRKDLGNATISEEDQQRILEQINALARELQGDPGGAAGVDPGAGRAGQDPGQGSGTPSQGQRTDLTIEGQQFASRQAKGFGNLPAPGEMKLGDVDELNLYSPISRAVSNNPQKTWDAKQFLAWLTKQPGIKEDELVFSGLRDLVEAKAAAGEKLTREQIENHLAEHEVQVHVAYPALKQDPTDERDGVVPDYHIGSFESVEPDESFFEDEARDQYLPDLLEEMEEQAEAEGRELDDGDRAEAMEEAIAQARYNYENDPDTPQTADVVVDGEVRFQITYEYSEWELYDVDTNEQWSGLRDLPAVERQIGDVLEDEYGMDDDVVDDQASEVDVRVPRGPGGIAGNPYAWTTRNVADAAQKWDSYRVPDLHDSGEHYREIFIVAETAAGVPWDAEADKNHWKGPDSIVAHVRFDVQHDADGNPVLFIHEIQSDWHQRARELRDDVLDAIVASGLMPAEIAQEKISPLIGYSNYDIDKQTWDWIDRAKMKIQERERQLSQQYREHESRDPNTPGPPIDFEAERRRLLGHRQNLGHFQTRRASLGLPMGPYRTTFHTLAMRVMLELARRNGFDRIAWATGRQQGEIYRGTMKNVEHLRWDSDAKKLTATISGQDHTYNQVDRHALGNYLGKESAERLMTDEHHQGDGVFEMDGPLTMASEGMTVFYDQLMPQAVKQIHRKTKATTAQLKSGSGKDHTIVRGFEETAEPVDIRRVRGTAEMFRELAERLESGDRDARRPINYTPMGPVVQEFIISEPALSQIIAGVFNRIAGRMDAQGETFAQAATQTLEVAEAAGSLAGAGDVPHNTAYLQSTIHRVSGATPTKTEQPPPPVETNGVQISEALANKMDGGLPRFASRQTGIQAMSRRDTVTDRGRRIAANIADDPEGDTIGVGSIVDYLADVVGAEIREGLVATTERSPADYLGPAYHLVRSRARGSQQSLHRVGVALATYLLDVQPEILNHLGNKLKALGRSSPVDANADVEHGFGELVRRWVVDGPDSLPPNILQPIRQRLKDHTLRVGTALDLMHEAWRAHMARSPQARLRSYTSDRKPLEPLSSRVEQLWHRALFEMVAGGSALETRVRKQTLKRLARISDQLARRFDVAWRDTPADIQTAHQAMIHIFQEVDAAVYGNRHAQEGLRIQTIGGGFVDLPAEAINTLLKGGFILPKMLDGQHGHWIYLTDYTLQDVIDAVGQDAWDDFEAYGWMRVAMRRHQDKENPQDYPGILEDLPPEVLNRELAKADQEHPEWNEQFERINHYMDQLLLVSVLSGELTAEQAVTIKKKWGAEEVGQYSSGYWPLPRRFGRRPQRSRGGLGPEPTAGIERAFGSQAPFENLLEAVEARVGQALEAFHTNRVILAVQQFVELAANQDEVPFEVKAELRRILAPLPLAWERVAELEPAEQRKVVADYLNERKAAQLGVESLPADQRLEPDDVEINFPGDSIWRRTKPRGVQIVAPWRNGTREFYEVADPILFSYFSRDRIPMGPIGKVAAYTGHMMRGMVQPWKRAITQTLGFAAWNIVSRDPSSAMLLGEGRLTLVPGGAALTGFWNRITGKYPQARVAGELLSKALDATNLKAHKGAVDRFLAVLGEGITIPGYRSMTAGERIQAAPGQAMSTLLKPVDLFHWMTGQRWLSEQAETLSREGAYVAARKAGQSDEAAQLAYDMVTGNFGERPGNQAVAAWVKGAGFLNPGMQILWQTYRKATDPGQPKIPSTPISSHFGGKLLYMTTLSFIGSVLYHMSLDDEDRERLADRRDEDRLRYMSLKIPGTKVHVRLPFDYGPPGAFQSLGWNLGERIMLDHNTDVAKTATFILSRALEIPWVTDVMGPHLKTALELQADYSFFFSSKIVPPWLSETYPGNPELQYTEKTAQIYRWMGRQIGASPIKVEYAVRQIFTGAMADSLKFIDQLRRDRPPDELSELPMFGRLFSREPRGWRTKHAAELIEDEQAYQAAKAVFDSLVKERADSKEVRQAAQAMAELAAVHEMYKAVKKISRKVRELERAQADPKQIQQLERRMTELIKRFRQRYQGAPQ